MIRSLIGLPLQFGIKGARVALDGATGVAERALGLTGELADALTKRHSPDLDLDGSEHEPAGSQPRRQPPSPRGAPEPEPEPPTAGHPAVTEAQQPPAPAEAAPVAQGLDEPRHVSAEPTLVAEVAEAGAQDGAGAQLHVVEPWDGYRQMTADDVIDRVTGASSAELAAVELYELSGRRRQTVLAAVRAEFERTDRGQ